MRVAVVSRILHFSGMMRWTSGISNGLKSLGHDVEMVFFRNAFNEYSEDFQFSHVRKKIVERGNLAKLSAMPGIILLRTNYFKNGFPTEDAPEPWSWFLIPVISKYFSSFDLLICHDQYSGISGYALKKFKGTDYIVFAHESVISRGPLFLRLPSGIIERSVFGDALLRCAVTQRTADESQNSLKMPFVVIPHGCSPHEGATAKKGGYFLFDTRWTETRDPYLILEIAKLCRNIKFIVCGSFVTSELFNRFRNAMNKMELTKNIQLNLNVSEQELSLLYENATAYIRWPAISKEGFIESGPSFGVYQALEAGCPLIVTKDLSISDILLETGAALVVPHNARDIASAILRLAYDDNLVAKMTEAAITTSRKWSWTNRAKTLMSYYESCKG